jgi:hypothetical protein
MADSESDYKVGLGRAPLHTRCKKGSPATQEAAAPRACRRC